MKNYIKKIFMCLMVLALVVTVLPVNAEAAVKLNKKTATVYVGEKVTIKLSGVAISKQTFKSSKTAVAKVDKKGVVTGVKAGKCNITITDTKTKKNYTCKITVKNYPKMTVSDYWFDSDFGKYVCLFTKEQIAPTAVKVNGKKVKFTKECYTPDEWGGDTTDYVTRIYFNEPLTEGNYEVTISAKKFSDYIIKDTVNAPITTSVVQEPFVRDGKLYVIMQENCENANVKITVDGKEPTILNSFVNGDHNFIVWIDGSELSAGEHTINVVADGYEDYTTAFEK